MPLETRLLDDSLACEVIGLHLWEAPDEETIDELRTLWAHHPVLVFRRQALSENELADFTALSARSSALSELIGHLLPGRKSRSSRI